MTSGRGKQVGRWKDADTDTDIEIAVVVVGAIVEMEKTALVQIEQATTLGAPRVRVDHNNRWYHFVAGGYYCPRPRLKVRVVVVVVAFQGAPVRRSVLTTRVLEV